MIEIICAVLGIIQGILALLNKRSNWIVYTLQMLFLIIFSYHAKLYGDMTQNIIYFFICIYAYIMWKSSKIAKQISLLSNPHRVYTILFTIISTYGIGMILSNTDDPMPYLDAFTTITTVVALFLMSFRYIESWIVWFMNDIAYMYQYFHLPNQATYLFYLYCIWTLLAIGTFMYWMKLYKQQN